MKKMKHIIKILRRWTCIIVSKTSKTLWFRYQISKTLPCWIWHIMQHYTSLIHSGIFTFVFHSLQKLIWSCSVPSKLFHRKEWYKVQTSLLECLIKHCVTKIQGDMAVLFETARELHALGTCFYPYIQWTRGGCGSVLMVGEKKLIYGR
jgi:hypothetical protein